MKYESYSSLLDDFEKLDKDIWDFIDDHINDIDDVNDIIKLYRLVERMSGFYTLVVVVWGTEITVQDMENEKDVFTIQKNFNRFEESLSGTVDTFIHNCRNWKFNDYRCIDYIKRLLEFMLNAKEFLFE